MESDRCECDAELNQHCVTVTDEQRPLQPRVVISSVSGSDEVFSCKTK